MDKPNQFYIGRQANDVVALKPLPQKFTPEEAARVIYHMFSVLDIDMKTLVLLELETLL